ncbi:GNAT family N-acetyltransferase [Sphingomonas sp. Marseille-Q8236]
MPMTDKCHIPDYPGLSTARLSLRRPAIRDAAAIARIAGQWDVARRLTPVPHPYTVEDAHLFLTKVVPKQWIWAITRHGTDYLFGIIGLTPGRQGDRAELGYWLDPDHWGKGIMSEAGRAVLSYGFDMLNLPLITSGYFQDNPASGRVLAKLGFVETAHAMRACLAMGRDVPSVEVERRRETAVT